MDLIQTVGFVLVILSFMNMLYRIKKRDPNINDWALFNILIAIGNLLLIFLPETI